MIVVDSSALVAIIRREPDAEALARALVVNTDCLIGAPTYLECAMVIAKYGDVGSRALASLMADVAIAVVPFDHQQAQTGLEAFKRFGKGRHPAKLNFGDCFAYALAKSRNLPLLFKGDDFALTDIKAVPKG